MAVDTAEKRYSMINFGDGTNIHLLPEVDGGIEADDRAHLLDLYSGIALAAPSVIGAKIKFASQRLISLVDNGIIIQ